ncbi:MAG: hypothetical protein AB7I25_12880 [Vicinamibacterales bacterium]
MSLGFRGRSLRHLTPAYLYWRARLGYTRSRHPADPSLTRESIGLLAHLLRPSDVGAEWGAGNSTGWFAERTARLTSFETSPAYYPVVRENLIGRGLRNVDLQCVPFEWVPDEDVCHASDLMTRASAIPDESLDYALVDTAPRSCLCKVVVTKLKAGGLLVLDNANWYMPPPATLRPFPVGSVSVALGSPGSGIPDNRCMPAFLAETAAWRRIWTSNGVAATLLLFKP